MTGHGTYCFGIFGVPDSDETFVCTDCEMRSSLNPAYSGDVILFAEIDEFPDNTVMCIPEVD